MNHKELSDEQIAELLDEAACGIRVGGVYTHPKSGGVYIAECVALEESTLTPVVVYQRFGTGIRFTRPVAEFRERFLWEGKR